MPHAQILSFLCHNFGTARHSDFPSVLYSFHHPPTQKTIMYNLAELPKEDKDKVNVDLAASGVAYKERLGKPVIDVKIERQQPEHLREYFRERLVYYRELSKRFPQGYECNNLN